MEQEKLIAILETHEATLSWKRGGTIHERLDFVLSQYRTIADNAILEAKRFMEDTKVQFRAIEIIVEGLTDEGMNHGQKRVIANHVISTIRRVIDRIDNTNYDYSTSLFERYSFFRSDTPERKLYEKFREMKYKLSNAEQFVNDLKSQFPDVVDKIQSPLPF